jgi:Flp pilus assembly protein TadG
MKNLQMNRETRTQLGDRWSDQRGAALIMTLLLSTLLLIVGGALILTTNMATGLAVDSTAELQAYYAAEAGANAALNVLRRNVQSSPTGTSATFRNAVNNPTLNLWLPYGATINGTSVISLNTNPVMGYAISVVDPDSTPVGTEPDRVLVRVTGYGPSASQKQLEFLFNRHLFEFDPVAAILVRGNDDGTSTMPAFNIGNSNAKEYSGYDHAHPSNSLPVFGVTHANDYNAVGDEIASAKPNTVSGVEIVKQIGNSDLPDFLQTADNARAFLASMKATAIANGRYFTGTPSSYGTTANPQFTFCDGNCTLGDGAGLLIVTGTLTGNGNVGFNGIILVLGDGVFIRNGGGNGDTYGAIVVAKFARTWPTSENSNPHLFLTPTYDMNGGGNSTTGYDSQQVDNALSALGVRTLGIREY